MKNIEEFHEKLSTAVWSCEMVEKCWLKLKELPVEEVEACLQCLSVLLQGYFPRKKYLLPKGMTKNFITDSGRSLKRFLRVLRVSKEILIVYSIGIMFKENENMQCIKLWDIFVRLPCKKIDREIASIKRLVYQFHDEYIEYCLREDCKENMSTPIVFHVNEPRFTYGVDDRRWKKSWKIKPCGSLTNVKSYIVQPSLWRSIYDSAMKGSFSITLPLALSKEEVEVASFGGSSFIIGRSGTGKSTVMLYRMLLCYFQKKLELKQVLISSSASLVNFLSSTFKRMLLAEGINIPINLHRMDHELPKNSSKLPCFLTYNNFISEINSKLHRPYLYQSEAEATIQSLDQELGRNCTDYQTWDNLVTFQKFYRFYWPSISNLASRTLSSNLLYTEIVSCIKGSVASMKSSTGCVERNQYIELSDKREGEIFSKEVRELIYDLFLLYEKRRLMRHEWDYPDLCYYFAKEIAGNRISVIPGVHFLYIDEVQDFLPCQLYLLKYVVKNVNGCHFAGDTAQCVNAGTNFSFNRLADLLFSDFFENSSFGDRKNSSPRTFMLYRNHRSHGAILSVGNELVRLLNKFFPNEVDKFPSETSLTTGNLPEVFLESSIHDFRCHLFGKNIKELGPDLTLGCNQVILVRAEETKKYVKRFLKKSTVLTIFESKGLEWHDVFIFDFFKDSPFQSNWRVLQNKIFDSRKHRLLFSELKLLYVAVTRARKRLFFFDQDTMWREPMKKLLSTKLLISCVEVEPRPLALSCSKEEWDSKGFKLREADLLEEALNCFNMAENSKEITLTQAMIDEHEAIAKRELNFTQGSQALFDRAYIGYLEVNEERKAAKVLMYARRFKDAAKLFEKLQLYDKMFVALFKGNHVDRALSCYKKYDGLFSAGFSSRKEFILEKLAQKLLDIDNKRKMMESLRLCDRKNFIRSFLKRKRQTNLLVSFDEESNNFKHVAQSYEREFKYDMAAQNYYLVKPPDKFSVIKCIQLSMKYIELLTPSFNVLVVDCAKNELFFQNFFAVLKIGKSMRLSTSILMELEDLISFLNSLICRGNSVPSGELQSLFFNKMIGNPSLYSRFICSGYYFSTFVIEDCNFSKEHIDSVLFVWKNRINIIKGTVKSLTGLCIGKTDEEIEMGIDMEFAVLLFSRCQISTVKVQNYWVDLLKKKKICLVNDKWICAECVRMLSEDQWIKIDWINFLEASIAEIVIDERRKCISQGSIMVFADTIRSYVLRFGQCLEGIYEIINDNPLINTSNHLRHRIGNILDKLRAITNFVIHEVFLVWTDNEFIASDNMMILNKLRLCMIEQQQKSYFMLDDNAGSSNDCSSLFSFYNDLDCRTVQMLLRKRFCSVSWRSFSRSHPSTENEMLVVNCKLEKSFIYALTSQRNVCMQFLIQWKNPRSFFLSEWGKLSPFTALNLLEQTTAIALAFETGFNNCLVPTFFIKEWICPMSDLWVRMLQTKFHHKSRFFMIGLIRVCLSWLNHQNIIEQWFNEFSSSYIQKLLFFKRLIQLAFICCINRRDEFRSIICTVVNFCDHKYVDDIHGLDGKYCSLWPMKNTLRFMNKYFHRCSNEIFSLCLENFCCSGRLFRRMNLELLNGQIVYNPDPIQITGDFIPRMSESSIVNEEDMEGDEIEDVDDEDDIQLTQIDEEGQLDTLTLGDIENGGKCENRIEAGKEELEIFAQKLKLPLRFVINIRINRKYKMKQKMAKRNVSNQHAEAIQEDLAALKVIGLKLKKNLFDRIFTLWSNAYICKNVMKRDEQRDAFDNLMKEIEYIEEIFVDIKHKCDLVWDKDDLEDLKKEIIETLDHLDYCLQKLGFEVV